MKSSDYDVDFSSIILPRSVIQPRMSDAKRDSLNNTLSVSYFMWTIVIPNTDVWTNADLGKIADVFFPLVALVSRILKPVIHSIGMYMFHDTRMCTKQYTDVTSQSLLLIKRSMTTFLVPTRLHKLQFTIDCCCRYNITATSLTFICEKLELTKEDIFFSKSKYVPCIFDFCCFISGGRKDLILMLIRKYIIRRIDLATTGYNSLCINLQHDNLELAKWLCEKFNIGAKRIHRDCPNIISRTAWCDKAKSLEWLLKMFRNAGLDTTKECRGILEDFQGRELTNEIRSLLGEKER
jgi:hypothetical protein